MSLSRERLFLFAVLVIRPLRGRRYAYQVISFNQEAFIHYTIASYERIMQVLYFSSLMFCSAVKSLLSLLFVPPFAVHIVTSDPETLNLFQERSSLRAC